MNDSTTDQQQIGDELMNLILQRVYTQIAPNLSEEDIVRLEELNKQDPSGQAQRDFLLTKVPNFDELFKQEAALMSSELGAHPSER